MRLTDLTSLRLADLAEREWSVINPLGARACSSVSLMNTRRTHGLLIAPIGRNGTPLVILSRVEESLRAPGRCIDLACNQYPGIIHPRGDQFLRSFEDEPQPCWHYSGDGWTLEKCLRLLPDRSTTLLSWRLTDAPAPFEFAIRPLLALRPARELACRCDGRLTPEPAGDVDWRLPASATTPELFFSADGALESAPCWYYNTIYRYVSNDDAPGLSTDAAAGPCAAGGMEDLWSPALIRWTLPPGQCVHFACSTEPVSLASLLASPPQQPVSPPPAPPAVEVSTFPTRLHPHPAPRSAPAQTR